MPLKNFEEKKTIFNKESDFLQNVSVYVSVTGFLDISEIGQITVLISFQYK